MKFIVKLAIFISIIALIGCSSFSSNKTKEQFLYIGNDQRLINALSENKMDYKVQTKIDHLKDENIDKVIMDKEFFEEIENDVIYSIVNDHKEIFIKDYDNTKSISEKLFGSHSFDELRDDNRLLIKLQNVNEKLEMVVLTYKKDQDKKTQNKKLLDTIIHN
jgi:hypothetical protein